MDPVYSMPNSSPYYCGINKNLCGMICNINTLFTKNSHTKGDSAFPWIFAQPLSEPLLNMHRTFYMSVITYLDMLPYHVVFGLMTQCALSTT